MTIYDRKIKNIITRSANPEKVNAFTSFQMSKQYWELVMKNTVASDTWLIHS